MGKSRVPFILLFILLSSFFHLALTVDLLSDLLFQTRGIDGTFSCGR